MEGKSVEEKDAQPTERTAALWGLSSKIDSRIWVNFTRNGLRLGSRHQEPPHTDVSRNLATVVVRGVLPGLRRRRTWLLPSGPKSSFQMRASFEFHLETKVLESGGRVEKLIAQESKKCRWAEGHYQRNLCFHTTSAVPQTDSLHATPNRGSN